jgi:hypothetical protein
LCGAGALDASCLDLGGGLGDPSGGPAVVESGGERKVAVEVALAEDLGKG